MRLASGALSGRPHPNKENDLPVNVVLPLDFDLELLTIFVYGAFGLLPDVELLQIVQRPQKTRVGLGPQYVDLPLDVFTSSRKPLRRRSCLQRSSSCRLRLAF
jgi:hypothetical protein